MGQPGRAQREHGLPLPSHHHRSVDGTLAPTDQEPSPDVKQTDEQRSHDFTRPCVLALLDGRLIETCRTRGAARIDQMSVSFETTTTLDHPRQSSTFGQSNSTSLSPSISLSVSEGRRIENRRDADGRKRDASAATPPTRLDSTAISPLSPST